MATNWSVCGICEIRQTNKSSVVWCFECDEGLCEDCNEHHSVSKASRVHDTVNIDTYRELPIKTLKIAQSCRKHNEKYQIYCQKHDCPCCKICIVEKHNECNVFRDINDVIKNVKSSNAFLELENTLTEVAKNIRRIRLDREENLFSLMENKSRIVEHINQIRSTMNNHFDRLQDKVMKELEASEEEESKKIRKILSDIGTTEKEIEESISSLESIKQHAPDLQAFLAMKKLEYDVKDKVESIRYVSISGDLNKTTISCKADSTIEDILNTFHNFGEIIIETKPTILSFPKRKEKQAQVILSLPTMSIYDLKLTLKQTVSSYGTNITGCAQIPGGKIAFSSYSQDCLQILNSDGSKNFEIKPKFSTFDVVYDAERSSLLLTTGGGNCLIEVDITTKKVTKTIQLKTRCDGAYISKRSLVYCAGDKGVQQMDLQDGSVTTLTSEYQYVFAYVAILGHNLYYVNKNKTLLTCFDLDKTKTNWTFQYKNILEQLSGISIDNDGNVYVVGHDSHNCVVISSDGQRYRVLLSAKDGLEHPNAIHYDITDNKLLVANRRKPACMFNVSK